MMPAGDTIVIQSRPPGPPPDAVQRACQSVEDWAQSSGFAYQRMGDDIFEMIPPWVLDVAGARKQMAVDIARLRWTQDLLDQNWAKVIWLDADALIFNPNAMVVDAPEGFAFGREHWVQPGDKDGALKVYKNVHNAFMVFTDQGRWALDFYLESALRILKSAGPNTPPQLVGPKLLTALNNVVQFPLIDCVGMASPLVLADVARGGGDAWEALAQAHENAIAGLNLCTSLLGTTVDDVEIDHMLLSTVTDKLLSKGAL